MAARRIIAVSHERASNARTPTSVCATHRSRERSMDRDVRRSTITSRRRLAS